MRKLIALIIALTQPTLAVAQVQDLASGRYTPGFFSTPNMVKNPSCFTNTANITASGGSLTKTTTTPAVGGASCLIDASSSGQTYKFATKTFENAMKFQNCEARFDYTGDASLYKAYVEQPASTEVSQEITLVDGSTNGRSVSINFPCGDPANATIVTIESTSASAAAIKVDNVYAGFATNIGSVSVMTDPISYTPTYAGFGTVTTAYAYYVRSGSTIKIWGRATAGTVSGTTAAISLPTGISVASIQAINGVVGVFAINDGATVTDTKYNMLAGPNVTSINIGRRASGGELTNRAGNLIAATGDVFSWYAEVPVTGWTSSGNAIRADQSNYEWTSWSPISVGSQGFGTIAAESCFHKRDGQYLLMNCKITAGTVAASEARITLPNSLTVSSTAVPSIRIAEGYWVRDNASATTVKTGTILMLGGDAFVTFGRNDYTTAVSPLTKANGSTAFSNSDVITFFAKVPITGWGENQKSPILTGAVTSGTNGALRVEAFSISSAGVVSAETSDVVNGNCAVSGTSIYTCTLNSGSWGARPICVSTMSDTAISANRCKYGSDSTSSSLVFRCGTDTGSATALAQDVICLGSR
jgi:hypothetical protein